MKEYTYQTDYSTHFPKVLNPATREIKAGKILAVLQDSLGDLAPLVGLDIGCSAGGITRSLGPHFRSLVGVDIDEGAVATARRTPHPANVSFEQINGLELPYPGGAFDVVICNHVYEHVPDADRLMGEIQRVLRPGGHCYFAAGNRLMVIEGHYGLPFLSWLPKTLAHRYLQVTGKGRFYYEKHRTLRGLRRLAGGFAIQDYTRRIVAEPSRFACEDLIPPGSRRARWGPLAVAIGYPLVPTYIWMLHKRDRNVP